MTGLFFNVVRIIVPVLVVVTYHYALHPTYVKESSVFAVALLSWNVFIHKALRSMVREQDMAIVQACENAERRVLKQHGIIP